MACCPHCESADKFFDPRLAESELRAYQRHGATGTTRRLLDALKANGVAGMTLLDIGGGVGVIQHELHAAGVTPITGVDASAAYLRVARQEAGKRGYASEARYVHGDFVALAGQLDPADIVTLDRVVCCYPDMPALVSAAAAKARHFLALVYPRDRWWTRLGVAMLNVPQRLQSEPFRSYVHPTLAVENTIAANALRKIAHFNGLVWQVVVFAR